MTLAKEAKDLGIPLNEFVKKVVDEHKERIDRAGFPLPFFDKIFFNAVIVFLSFFK
jgi:hypothetical protein